MPIEAGQTLLHYRLVDKLGEGGMGVVWRALDTTLDREVAIKLLPQAFADDRDRLERFEREAKLLASLNHPGIAAVYGLHEVQTPEGLQRFIAMELVGGEDLAERLKRGPLPVGDALEIASQIAQGLSAAHEAGVIHRDLKPANVKLTPEGKIKVLDFGLAKAFDATDRSSGVSLAHSPTVTSAGTMMGVILGTAAYMSPEQARGMATDRRTDIWAFGAMLFEMLTGRTPFEGEVVSDIMAKILERQPSWDSLPKPMHPGVRRLLGRCLTKSPDERLRDAADIRLELKELLGDPTGREVASSASGSVPTAAAPPWRRTLPWLLLAAALAWFVVGPMLRPAAPPDPLVHFEILPPPGQRFFEFESSPDGSAVVFAAGDREGRRSLWIRRLESAELRRIPGTDGAWFPFWAPDMRSVGFFQGGKLRTVDLHRSSRQTIADAPNGRGGDWSHDDTILFTPDGGDVLYSVPASGGTPVARTVLGEGEATHRFPHFIGKTRKFTYCAHNSDSSVFLRRYMGSLDSQEVIALGDGMSESLTPPGYLLAIREKTLVAQPFDAASGVLSGNPFPLANGVSDVFPRTGSSAFSVSDNGVLTYLEKQRLDSRIFAYDRTGRRIEAVSPVGGYSTPRLSPDKRHVAFMRTVNDSVSVWALDLARGAATRLSSSMPIEATNIGWSADSRQVYYGFESELFRVPVVGGTPQVVFDGQAQRQDQSDLLVAIQFGNEASDGSFLTFAAWNPVTDFNVWLLRLDGERELLPLVEAPGVQGRPRISPDSRWVAYDSNESGRFEIYVCAADSPEQRWLISADGGSTPFWSDDGSELYYVAADYGIMAVSVDPRAREFKPGLPQRLFEGPMAVAGDEDRFYRQPLSVGVDGDRFLFHEPEGIVRDDTIDVVLNWERLLEE